MDSDNPFAPPATPLDSALPTVRRPPESDRVRAAWLFPTGISAGLAVFCLGLSVFAAYMAVHQYWATGGDLDAGTPIVRRSIIVAGGSGVAGVALGLIAHAWHQRRWGRALILMASFGASIVLLVLAVRGR